jgi:hypothetical protein
VCAGSSSNLANPLTKGPRDISPNMSVKLPLLRALESNWRHLDTVPTRIKTWAEVSKYELYSQEGNTPLDNCLWRDRRRPAATSYLVSSLASLLVSERGNCCYVYNIGAYISFSGMVQLRTVALSACDIHPFCPGMCL